jgi:hypothetical protein
MNSSCGQIIRFEGGLADGAEMDMSCVGDWDEPKVLYVCFNATNPNDLDVHKSYLVLKPGVMYNVYVCNLFKGVYHHKGQEIAT